MSELQTAGMLPYIAQDLNEPTSRIGLLVSIYALGMAIGGPIIAYFLRMIPPKRALSLVICCYAFIELLAPIIHKYWWLSLTRLLTGCLAGATFGLALTFAARIASSPNLIGRNVSVVLSGLMVGTVLGLPISHHIASQWDWQASFYLLGIISFFSSIILGYGLPKIASVSKNESSEDLRNLRDPVLWSRYLVSFLTIGAAYGSFSFFTPLLQENAGFQSDTTTLILFCYGICTVIGNIVVGRFSDSHPVNVMRIGHSLLFLALVLLSLFSHSQPISLVMVLIVGLFGISMNSALVTRVTCVGGTGSLVTTVHTAVITMGVTVGTMISSSAMGIFGNNPVIATWTGAILVIFASSVLIFQKK